MTTDQVPLEEVMRAIAAGDNAFVITLYEHYGHKVRGVVCRHLRDMGRRDLLADTDEVHGLTIDACFVIGDHAASWNAGGALPWVWAERAIHAVVVAGAGHRSVELDDEHHQRPEPYTVVVGREPYRQLVAERADVAEFDHVLRQVTSARDYGVYVEYLIQQEFGDRSPANTVARQFELSAANVRQIVCRIRRRLETEWVAA